jgi:hypothetical protein
MVGWKMALFRALWMRSEKFCAISRGLCPKVNKQLHCMKKWTV